MHFVNGGGRERERVITFARVFAHWKASWKTINGQINDSEVSISHRGIREERREAVVLDHILGYLLLNDHTVTNNYLIMNSSASPLLILR